MAVDKDTTPNERSPENKTNRKELLPILLGVVPYLWTNWWTLLGTIISGVSGCIIIFSLAFELVNPVSKIYLTAVIFIVMPAFFVLGLIIIPLGLWWERKHKRAAYPNPIQAAFQFALADKKTRRTILFVGVITAANFFIIGAAGQQAFHLMDSPAFCGKLCHQVMTPEYTAYLRSPHSRVACVQCHIGPGASWAVKSKIAGLRQVAAVLGNTFHRPIPTPVKELRPARDTCEQCHWPAKFHGNRIAFFTHYQDDEKNTPLVNGLVLKVGGENPTSKEFEGIHWHVSPEVELRYEALDDAREKIGKITVKKKGQVTAEYTLPGQPKGPVVEQRLMDCVDCHNRPSHVFDQNPAQALDRAFDEGRLDPKIPFLHKVASQLLGRNDLPRESAESFFRQGLIDTFHKDYPQISLDEKTIQAVASVLTDLYTRNIYPDLKIAWGSYPSHLGHRGEEQDKRGCFRCHDDEHVTKTGQPLAKDCDLCHEAIVEGEARDKLPSALRSVFSVKP